MAQKYSKRSAKSKEKILYRSRIVDWGKLEYPEGIPTGSIYLTLPHIYVKKGKVIPESEIGIGLERKLYTPKQVMGVDRVQYITNVNNTCKVKGFVNRTSSMLYAVRHCIRNGIKVGMLHMDLMTLPENEKTLEEIRETMRLISQQEGKCVVVINLQVRAMYQKDKPAMHNIRKRLMEDTELKNILRRRKHDEHIWKGWQKEEYKEYPSQTSRMPMQALILIKEDK